MKHEKRDYDDYDNNDNDDDDNGKGAVQVFKYDSTYWDQERSL